MRLQWNSSAPGNRAECVAAPRKVPYGTIIPVTLCGALALGSLATVAWLWFKNNAERLAKAAGPPGESQKLPVLLLLALLLVLAPAAANANAVGCCMVSRGLVNLHGQEPADACCLLCRPGLQAHDGLHR